MPPISFTPRTMTRPFPRPGSWAVTQIDGQRIVGIINDIGALVTPDATADEKAQGLTPHSTFVPQKGGDTADFHIVDERGDTIRTGAVALSALTQATIDDIPIPRRMHDVQAHRLGYMPTLGSFPRIGAHALLKPGSAQDGVIDVPDASGEGEAQPTTLSDLVGIIIALNSTAATVRFIDPLGHAVAIRSVSLGDLTQASHEHLPEHHQTSWQHAKELGYLPDDFQPPPIEEADVPADARAVIEKYAASLGYRKVEGKPAAGAQ